MRHQKTTAKLGRSQAARQALLSNLAAQLILYEAIQTTEAKAKALRPVIEPMITAAVTASLMLILHFQPSTGKMISANIRLEI
jgi:large subunit ribosomal protein L17